MGIGEVLVEMHGAGAGAGYVANLLDGVFCPSFVFIIVFCLNHI